MSETYRTTLEAMQPMVADVDGSDADDFREAVADPGGRGST